MSPMSPPSPTGTGIVAIPTLVKRLPAPPRQLVGDLADVDRVRAGLDLGPAAIRAVRTGRAMTSPPETTAADELGRLRTQIQDLDRALTAIRAGDVDAVVLGGPQGHQLYTLVSADRPYRVIVEEMGDGAVTVSERGIILYANQRLAELVGADRGRAARPRRHRARRRVRGDHAPVPADRDRARHHPPGQSSSWSTRRAPSCRCSPRSPAWTSRASSSGASSSPTSPTGAAAKRNWPAPTPS